MIPVSRPAEPEEPVHSLQRLWRGGPAAWNAALTLPQVLIPFFLLAATAPFITQYFVDNYGWTGGEFWVRILTTCAMYACLALALNLVVGYAGLLNLGFIAFFAIGSYAYALVASDQLNHHFALLPALATVVLVSIGFALLVGVPALRLRGDYLAILTLAFASLVLVLLACGTPRRVPIRPAARDDRGVSFLPFASSRVERFSDQEGRPCPELAGRVRNNLLGWESGNPDDPACTHDTLHEGTRAGLLEMRWRSELPQDGSYDLVTLGYSVGAWGRVTFWRPPIARLPA